MFKVGDKYNFEMLDPMEPGTVTLTWGTILEVALPLIRIRTDQGSKEIILNASSQVFIKAIREH
jgi:hypothetical protein